MSSSLIAWIAVAVVCGYYAVAWLMVGRDPKPGIIVTRYEPPVDLSPAMLRFVWKEIFDDRAFWAAALSLVSKGVASMTNEDDLTLIRPTTAAKHKSGLPKEEQFLLDRILHRHGKKGLSMNLLDDETAYQAMRMAAALRQAAVGKWFLENRETVIVGAVLSLIPVCLSANSLDPRQWLVLALCLAAMAPGAYYLIFLLLRLRDTIRGSRKGAQKAILYRSLTLCAMIAPCLAALALGSVVLGVTFGSQVLFVTALMVGLDLAFLHLIKAPTAEGRKLLDEISGFRQFLASVEQFPMDRIEGPSTAPGLYEKYLPYAVALELEQAWSDKFIALADTVHEREFLPGSCAFYLGMWDGKPVQVVWKPGGSVSHPV